MSKRMSMMVVNATAKIEIPHGKKRIVVNLPCRIVGDKLYTMTRTFCTSTLQKIASAANDSDCTLVSYTLKG